MKSIAFINQKGGVGKTTSTINIGAGLSRLGKKVLLVDFDPQANLTYSFGISPEETQNTTYEFLKSLAQNNSVDPHKFLIKLNLPSTENLYLLPSNIGLSGLESNLKDHPEKELIFKKGITLFNQFDYVLIDCPPSLGLLTINVLSAVEEVYIPIQTEFFALQGLNQITNVIHVIVQAFNPSLKLGGLIGTKYNNRKLHKDVITYLRNNYKDTVFKTVIRDTIALAEAPSFGKDIYSYNPKSNGAKDYYALCKEILTTENKKAALL